MICGSSVACGCGFHSDSLQISNDAGIISIETFGPAVVAAKADVTSPFTNQIVHETSTGLTWMWTGSEWVVYGWTVAPMFIGSSVGVSVPHGDSAFYPDIVDEWYDPFGWHTAGSPKRVTPTLPGLYEFSIEVTWVSSVDYTRQLIGMALTGAQIQTGRDDRGFADAADYTGRGGIAKFNVEMDGATDYVEVQLFHTNDAAAARTVAVRATLEWKANPL